MYHTAFSTNPFSYTESFLTSWATECSALRTDSGSPGFVDDFEHYSPRHRFIGEHRSEHRPSGIEYGFGHSGLCQPGGTHVANVNIAKFSGQPRRKLVQEVFAPVGALGMKRPHATLFL